MIGHFVEKVSFIQFPSKFCERENLYVYLRETYQSVQISTKRGQGSENCPKKFTYYVPEPLCFFYKFDISSLTILPVIYHYQRYELLILKRNNFLENIISSLKYSSNSMYLECCDTSHSYSYILVNGIFCYIS